MNTVQSCGPFPIAPTYGIIFIEADMTYLGDVRQKFYGDCVSHLATIV